MIILKLYVVSIAPHLPVPRCYPHPGRNIVVYTHLTHNLPYIV